MKFYLFGSENSQDYDVLVECEDIPLDIRKAHDLCKHYNETLPLKGKELNCNLITIKDYNIVNCFKGTCDELINCLFYTYYNHKQFYHNPILQPIERDLNEKILRVARFLITFYSRTELRTEIKAALRGDLKSKIDILRKIDYLKMTSFPDKKEKIEDIYKVIAFQFGQVFSLIDGYEPDSYTKNGIIKNYKNLSNIINRKTLIKDDLNTLNDYLNRFVNYVEENIKTLKLNENFK